MTELSPHNDLEHLEKYAGEHCRKNVVAAYKNSNSLTLDDSLDRDIYYMSNAIMEDPVKLKNTPDLGVSQAYRLHRFLGRQDPNIGLSELHNHLRELDALGLPVIGAEFHLPVKQEVERLEEKLFVLNMAQYQDGSSIPLSRIEENLVEIRMNPSYFPVTMANWELMRKLLPIDETTFFLPITPLPENDRQLEDIKSLANIIYAAQYEIPTERNYSFLRRNAYNIGAIGIGIGLGSSYGTCTGTVIGVDTLAISAGSSSIAGSILGVSAGSNVKTAVTSTGIMSINYSAGLFAGSAIGASAGDDIMNFVVAGVGLMSFIAGMGLTKDVVNKPFLGEHYLGQTQTLENEEYRLTPAGRKLNGKIPIKKKDEYQLNLYSGFGRVFPEQAYYLSMAYIAPEILETIREKAGVVSLKKASKMHPEKIRDILTTVNSQILENGKTRRATEIGQEIRELLSL